MCNGSTNLVDKLIRCTWLLDLSTMKIYCLVASKARPYGALNPAYVPIEDCETVRPLDEPASVTTYLFVVDGYDFVGVKVVSTDVDGDTVGSTELGKAEGTLEGRKEAQVPSNTYMYIFLYSNFNFDDLE